MRKILLLISTVVFAVAMAGAQDEQSLGDLARQARQQKQQKDGAANKDAAPKDTAAKDPTVNDSQAKAAPATNSQPTKAPRKVITNDEIPEHIVPARPVNPGSQPGGENAAPPPPAAKASAEQWTAQIQAHKANIAAMESQIKSLQDSIQFAGGNCVSNCEQWNERQKQKLDQVEVMKSQLEQQRKQLEDMQEKARKQGYGSSVYDP